jgi:hypothetical protein
MQPRILFERLLESRFRNLAGMRLSAQVPVSDALINDLIAENLSVGSTLVRDVKVKAHSANRVDVFVQTGWSFLPPIKVAVTIDRQPRMPDSPELFLRWMAPAGLTSLASRLLPLATRLPAGISMDGDLIAVDMKVLLESRGVAWLLAYVTRAEVTTDEGRTIFHVELNVPEVGQE